MRTAALLCILALPASAQDYFAGRYQPADPDDLDIRESSEGYLCEIVFDNSASMSSQPGTSVLTWEEERPDGSIVTHEFIVTIEIGGREVDGREILRVTAPEHLIAIPDYAEVPDGETFTVQIAQAMF